MDQTSTTDQPSAATAQTAPVTVEISADQTTGYAAIQNNVPVIRGLTLTNSTDRTLTDLAVQVRCSPPFAVGTRLHFASLAPHEIRKIAPVDLQPDHDYLIKLDEAERSVITVSVSSSEGSLGDASHAIDVLAYDQWAGLRSLPELLAAFCMPNSRVVDQLIGKASGILRASASDASMDGYQSKNRERVWRQVSALYSALLAEDIHYSNPPASFGTNGQKIRTPERVLDGRVATCLDLAMLFASCLEQVGLRPIVLFKEGHAWVGVWLIDTSFPTAVLDDVQAVRKRVKSGELLTFECTGVASAQKASLRWATSTGDAHLLDEDGSFRYVVDIHRARQLQIRALPSRSEAPETSATVIGTQVPAIEDAPPLPPLDPELIPAVELDEACTPEGRLAKWKSKLLDLTLRNRLLNFKATKTNLRIVCPDPGAIEDSLSEGAEFRIRPAPQLMEGADPREATVFSARTAQLPLDALAEDALKRRELIVDIPEAQLDGKLVEIFRAAESAQEEGGVNTLFLTFGLLQWREDKSAETSHLAPILLIPVTLTRQSVRSGFKLTRHDDDALVNPTLLQKLALEFSLKLPSFDVLPADDKGLDVEKIFQTFRLGVKELEGWEVKEVVHLGIFSFTKYLMWKDLQDRQQQLQESVVVSHLINNPGKAFSSERLGGDSERLDEKYRPQDLLTPLLSDSSQLQAICAASDGTNLVVEGPPGTGKSQTITNLIAHLLSSGKTVLFVSEKMAALEVVHRRLSQLGLGPFCLELHSAKARKADVLEQMGVALAAAGSRTVRDWELEAERLAALRQELNGLAAALHREHPNGLTIYEAIGTCIERANTTPATMEWADPNIHSLSDLESLRETSRQMSALASQVDDIAAHPLSAIASGDWTPTWQQEVLDGAASLARAAEALREASAPILRLFGLPEQGPSLTDFAHLDRLADVLVQAPKVPAGVARAAHDEAARNTLSRLRDRGLQRKAAWDALGGQYTEDVAELDAAGIKAARNAAQAAWWPKSWLAGRELANKLRPYRVDGQRPNAEAIEALVDRLAKINAEDEAIEALATDARRLLQDGFAAHKTDLAHLEMCERWAVTFSEAVMRMAGGDLDRLQALRTKLEPYVSENRALLRPDSPVGAGLIQYRDYFRVFAAEQQRVSKLAHCEKGWAQEPTAPGALPRILGIMQGWQLAARQLQPWCLWQRVKSKAIAQGLAGTVRALESGDVALSDTAVHFEYSYRNWWVKKAIDREPSLCGFSSADHERKIHEFRKADEKFQKLTEQYIVARLSGQVPATTALAPGADSEMGKLRREIQKKSRHMPIRQLVQNLPTLLPKLKPCLLMSPLSVAQYLEAGHSQFDVVIFDEASQIPVWDAVGAIARGKQLICVGDPKQLPPTNFFNRVYEDDDPVGDDDVQDLESILDECLGIGLPQLSLNWHYRSRHESLITFSNVTYYDSRLITFPSPVTEDKAVRFHRVHGVYDRGGSRTNRAEAEAIVNAIEQHYLDPERKKQTLGVVTFNQPQQELIENLLDARRRASATLDAAIAQSSFEPLFVKNLENVQGDERDVIYFSITYGPDAAGKVTMTFGPLNTEGGHRRLNVAVSRARQCVVIFSTLLPEQIDLARVRAAGVRDLKNYLEFAIRGPRALVEQALPTGREPDSPFERQVISAIRKNGWEVHPQVGVSGYRIDIGIVDPRAPGSYLLGVECDGRTYHSGATARDRDRLRHLVLEGLGWKLHRIWSTDWWLNPEGALAKLLAKLNEVLAQDPVAESTEQEAVDIGKPDVVPESAEEPVYAKLVEPGIATPQPSLPEYRATALRGRGPTAFYEYSSRAELRRQLVAVINAEGPISDGALFKRIARAWDLQRTGRQIREILGGLVPENMSPVYDGTAWFYWPEGTSPATWEQFRVSGTDDDSKRAIEEICLEEIGNLALFILSEHGSTTFEDLARTICRQFGIARTTSDAEERISQALTAARVGALVHISDGPVKRISLSSSPS